MYISVPVEWEDVYKSSWTSKFVYISAPVEWEDVYKSRWTSKFVYNNVPVESEDVLEDPGWAVEEELPGPQREGVTQRQYISLTYMIIKVL